MMTDYYTLPKYEHMTPLDARYNYAMDLLHEWCPQYGTTNTPCLKCPFPERMKRHDVCCGWLVGERQEESIAVLEELIEKRRTHDG